MEIETEDEADERRENMKWRYRKVSKLKNQITKGKVK